VVGVDLSEYMLSKCREAASRENMNPYLIQADMRELQFDSEFDAVIIMWNSFGYLESDEENQKVLNVVSNALKPGGRLLLDFLVNRDSLQKRFGPRTWYKNDAATSSLVNLSLIRNRPYPSEDICLHDSGERSEACFDLRLYTYGELENMLNASGMTVQSVWGDRSKSEFSPDSKAMEIVAVKV